MVILIKMFIFLFFLNVFSRLICEILSRIAVKISFYWVVHIVYIKQHYLQQLLRHYIYVTACIILLRLFYIWTPYVSLSNYKVLILKFYIVPVRIHGVTKCFKLESTFEQTRRFLSPKKKTLFLTYVTATLRALFVWRGLIIILNKFQQGATSSQMWKSLWNVWLRLAY